MTQTSNQIPSEELRSNWQAGTPARELRSHAVPAHVQRRLDETVEIYDTEPAGQLSDRAHHFARRGT